MQLKGVGELVKSFMMTLENKNHIEKWEKAEENRASVEKEGSGGFSQYGDGNG